MPASTIGKPVRPGLPRLEQRSILVDLDRVERRDSSSTTRCRAIHKAPRRRSREKPAPAGKPARPCPGPGRRPSCAGGWCRTSDAPTSGWWRRGRAGRGRRRSRRARCSTNFAHCLRAAVSPAGSSSSHPGVGDVHPARHVGRVDPARGVRARVGRRPPAVPAPGVVKRREHLVRRAVALGDHGPGTPDTANPLPPAARHPARRARRRRVAGRTVSKSADTCTDVAPIALASFGIRCLRPATGHQQPAVEVLTQVAQRVVQVLQPARLPTTPSAVGPGHSRPAPRRRPPPRPTAAAGRAAADRAGTTTAWACIDAARNSR